MIAPKLSFFLKHHTRLFAEPYWQSDLSSSIFFTSLMTTVLVHLLMKYVFHSKLRMIIFHDQKKKTLSLNFKSSLSQIFFKIDVLKKFAIFTGKHMCWIYFLIKLQGWRPGIEHVTNFSTWKRKWKEKSLFIKYYLCTQQNFMNPKLIHFAWVNY